MTESAKSLWNAVDLEINDYIGDGAEAYCLTDKILDEIREKYPAMGYANRIGLKRRIGKVLKARGYTETSTSPPTWVLHPLKKHDPIKLAEVPQYIIDTYFSLLQAQAVIEKAFPGIETAVAL